ncbi:rRNA pseudouridine synthase [Patescibacteria group bacterium]|nr:rRNA pseudouridine synthase [Patescibacteria group bacterium]MDL1953126.1 rRNA pseudouridine synthase [Candidatus Uhrbacteria bacterium UHB]RIL00418.1 MAG: pseudouridine synthase [Candidatus Uhrbacteria bacterium]
MDVRINKYLAEQGYCSRREADRLIQAGKVLINDRPAKLGDVVQEGDKVNVKGRAESKREGPVYIMLHKPVGYITTADRRSKQNVMELVRISRRAYPVGRLDVASSGLLIITNDGELANRLMHPSFEHEKEYAVEVNSDFDERSIRLLRHGVDLDDGRTLPAKATQTGPRTVRLTVREGRNRQIRRMMEALGYEVVSLMRIRIGELKMQHLPPGQWRYLKPSEIRLLRSAKRQRGEKRAKG